MKIATSEIRRVTMNLGDVDDYGTNIRSQISALETLLKDRAGMLSTAGGIVTSEDIAGYWPEDRKRLKELKLQLTKVEHRKSDLILGE